VNSFKQTGAGLLRAEKRPEDFTGSSISAFRASLLVRIERRVPVDCE
jgi:hypothetical protein